MKTDLSKKIIEDMDGSNTLIYRLVEWCGIPLESAKDFVKSLTFFDYTRLMEATVDRNPDLLSGASSNKGTKIGNFIKAMGGDDNTSDKELDNILKALSKNNSSGNNNDKSKPSARDRESEHNNFDDFDPEYIPTYIKNKKGEIDYKKIKNGDRIAWVDDYGKVLHGVVKKQNNDGTYDLDTYYGMQRGIEQGRLRTPRELVWRFKNRETPYQKGKRVGTKIKTGTRSVGNEIGSAINKLDKLATSEEVERELNVLRELAGLPIKETCSGGATGAGAIAAMPSIIGDIDKRPSTEQQVKARKKRDNKKKRKKRAQGKEVK